MFTHLVVPLDGSHLAEAALPIAAYFTRQLNATVTLLHIIEHDAPEEVHGERHLRTPEEAVAYLDEVARRAFPADAAVERHVHTTETANVASSIVAHGSELTMDMIIMCSHGRGGLGDWLSGTIAQQVVASGKIPVLLIRPTETAPQLAFECHRILVPLDGNPEHEEGLPAAGELAQRIQAAVHLLVVVPTLETLTGKDTTAGRAAGRLLPGATRAVLDMMQQEAVSYLQRLAGSFHRQSVPVTAEVARGDPASVITDTAQAIQADVIVLGTHGKAGLDAFWSGSLSPIIASRLRLPLLLVPVVENRQQA